MENTIENKTEKCPFKGWSCPQLARTRSGLCKVGYESCEDYMERELNFYVFSEFEPQYRR